MSLPCPYKRVKKSSVVHYSTCDECKKATLYTLTNMEDGRRVCFHCTDIGEIELAIYALGSSTPFMPWAHP